MATIITDDPRLIKFLDNLMEDQEDDLDFSHEMYDDYYCINIKPFKCNGCGRPVCYASAGPHLIIIWAEKDEDSILEIADLLMKDGNYDPRIVKYNRILGPCITYEMALKNDWIGNID